MSQPPAHYPSQPPPAYPGPHQTQYPPGYAHPMQYATPQPHDIGQDAGMRMLLPVGRSAWAIAAGYLGLLSVLIIFAPLALMFGIIAVIDIRRNPHRHGMGRATFGIVMGAIFSLLLLVWLVGMIVAS